MGALHVHRASIRHKIYVRRMLLVDACFNGNYRAARGVMPLMIINACRLLARNANRPAYDASFDFRDDAATGYFAIMHSCHFAPI